MANIRRAGRKRVLEHVRAASEVVARVCCNPSTMRGRDIAEIEGADREKSVAHIATFFLFGRYSPYRLQLVFTRKRRLLDKKKKHHTKTYRHHGDSMRICV